MTPTPSASSRRRLSREARTRQLLDAAWQLIADEGTDALTLIHLSEVAGVTKPLVYDHFGSRNGLLAALYEDYDVRQTALFDAAVAAAEPTREAKARTIAISYVNCVLTQGRDIAEVLAALSGSPELSAVKHRYQQLFIDKCSALLAPFVGPRGLTKAGLWGLLGAADALANAAVAGDIGTTEAAGELQSALLDLLNRSDRSAPD